MCLVTYANELGCICKCAWLERRKGNKANSTSPGVYKPVSGCEGNCTGHTGAELPLGVSEGVPKGQPASLRLSFLHFSEKGTMPGGTRPNPRKS